MFDYQVGLKKIESEVIPEKISSTYEELEELMGDIFGLFSRIQSFDSKSYFFAKKTISSNSSYDELLKQYEGIRRKEEKLLAEKENLERKIDKKFTNKENVIDLDKEKVIDSELKILDECNSKIILLEKNKSAIRRNIISNKRNLDKSDASRMDYESNIETIRRKISEKISELSSLLEKIDKENLGKDRLDGLTVEQKHIDKLNKHIEDYGKENKQTKYGSYVVDTIDSLFKDGMEINIELYKQLYDCATQMVSEYKKHNEMDYDNLIAINSLMNSRISKLYSEIYPYYYTDLDYSSENRHLDVLSDIVSKVNSSVKGEISEDDIEELKQELHKENLKVDMKHNYVGGRESYISQSLAYYKDLVSKKHRASK